jgi:hypothetical protein
MNLFILDHNIEKCAQYYNDKHLVKIILEATQLLNNSLIINNKEYAKNPVYRLTHKHHPLTKWCAENIANFEYALNLGLELCKEYTFRYYKIHKCQSILESFLILKYSIPDGKLTAFKLCMPEIYHTEDAVESYRRYYLKEKRHISNWSRRNKPDWWI